MFLMSSSCNKNLFKVKITNMKSFNFTIHILLIIILLASCATTRPLDPRVAIIDDYLSREIEIINVLENENNAGFMEIQVSGYNQTSFYKKLEYKIDWFDQNGFAIPTILSRWTMFPAYGNTEFRFKAIAPKKTASDFRVLIREGS